MAKHYFINDTIVVSNLIRKQGDGEEIIINGKGVIKQIRQQGNDIAYDVEFDITMTHRSPYGKAWTTDKNTFTLLHKRDSKHITIMEFTEGQVVMTPHGKAKLLIVDNIDKTVRVKHLQARCPITDYRFSDLNTNS